MYSGLTSYLSAVFYLSVSTSAMANNSSTELGNTEEKFWGKASDYKTFVKDRDAVIQKRLTSASRFQKISEREDRTVITVEMVTSQCEGRYFVKHRGCTVLKTADDLTIFKELFWHLKPATIIELGTFTGGSAVWMADMFRLMEVDVTVYSMDIDQSNIEERVKEIKPANVHFLHGSSFELEKTFPPEMLKTLPRPWLVIDDAHVNITGLMKYFDAFMQTGDYFIIEDLNPMAPCTLGFKGVYDCEYLPAGMNGVEELRKFLSPNADKYSVDSYFTDFFGYNATWNMHGYIRRM